MQAKVVAPPRFTIPLASIASLHHRDRALTALQKCRRGDLKTMRRCNPIYSGDKTPLVIAPRARGRKPAALRFAVRAASPL